MAQFMVNGPIKFGSCWFQFRKAWKCGPVSVPLILSLALLIAVGLQCMLRFTYAFVSSAE